MSSVCSWLQEYISWNLGNLTRFIKSVCVCTFLWDKSLKCGVKFTREMKTRLRVKESSLLPPWWSFWDQPGLWSETHQVCTCNTASQVPGEKGGVADFHTHQACGHHQSAGYSGQPSRESKRPWPPCAPCVLTARGQGGWVAVQRAAGGGGHTFQTTHWSSFCYVGNSFFFSKDIYSVFYNF